MPSSRTPFPAMYSSPLVARGPEALLLKGEAPRTLLPDSRGRRMGYYTAYCREK